MSVIKHWVKLTSADVMVDGVEIPHQKHGADLLLELFQVHIGDYPKFFKMDALCRAGFVASELLIMNNLDTKSMEGESCGVILFNTVGSLATDKKYQTTIDNYPSPSVFVYTLPNVLTGEIAIRNHYHGPTDFIVLDYAEASAVVDILTYAFEDRKLNSLLTGWVECLDENTFDIRMMIVEKEMISKKMLLVNEFKMFLNK
ncbi:MAG: hypothetical protein KBT04_06635 [Bacteroidales bacterium]|nr:hypothetical protein [Candidatus Colimorpha onthohippi]